MKMKNLLAVLSAGAIAVSAMSVAAFAETTPAAANYTNITVNAYSSLPDHADRETVYNSWTAALGTGTPTCAGDVVTVKFSETKDAATTAIGQLTNKGTDGAIMCLTLKSSNFTGLTAPDTVAAGGHDASNNPGANKFNFKSGYGWDTTDPAYNFYDGTLRLWIDPLADYVATGYEIGYWAGTEAKTLTVKVEFGTEEESAPAPVVSTTAPDSVVPANAEEAEAVPEKAELKVAPKAEKDASAIKAIDTAAAPEAVKEAIADAQALVEKGEAAVVDISLVVDGAETQPTGEVTVSVAVPLFLKAQNPFFEKTFYLYRVEKDGTLTDMKATYNRSEKKLQFKTNHFSTYIITLEPIESAGAAAAETTTAAETTAAETTAADAAAATTTAAEGTAAPAATEDKNQATGVALAIVPAVIAAAGVVISKKRK